MIKLTKEQISPEFLSNLDKKNNIVLCTPERDFQIINEISEGIDIFTILLAQDLNLSSCKVISTNLLEVIYMPQLKLSIPAGIKWVFDDSSFCEQNDIFNRIYKKYKVFEVFEDEEKKIPSRTLLTDLTLVGYADTIRMRSTPLQGILKKGMPMANLYFCWYIQTKNPVPQIENIYLIEDQYIYQEFVNLM